jgi:competence ComEA-like helix-hairpin-helix protein
MLRFIQKLKDYFSFRRGESVGLSALIALIVLILVFPYIYQIFKKETKTDFTVFDSEIKKFQINPSALNSDNYQVISDKKINGLSAISYRQSAQNYHSKDGNFIVELNGADSLELMRMNGIGPAFAKRILKYKEKLGGYWQKEQLLEVWGMDKMRYDGIKENIIVNRDSIHKINLNKTAFKKLLKHPYIGYEIARGIVEFRKNHGEIKTVEEIRKFKGMNDSIFEKIEPYVKVR